MNKISSLRLSVIIGCFVLRKGSHENVGSVGQVFLMFCEMLKCCHWKQQLRKIDNLDTLTGELALRQNLIRD